MRRDFPLILAMVRRDISQIHRQGFVGLVLVTFIIFLFGMVLFSMARGTIRNCTPTWTGDILAGCGPSERPEVTISADRVTGPAPLQVNLSSSVKGGSTDKYAWTFGEQGESDKPSATHTYSSPGVYVARVRAFFGEMDVFSGFLSIVVTAPGDNSLRTGINTNVSEAGAPLAVAFTSTVDGGRPPYSYAWSFGDGTNGSGAAQIHVFTDAGERDVNLTVRDAGGNETRASVRIGAFGPGEGGGLPFTALDVVFGYHVLVTMLIPAVAFATAYGAEARKGTVRTLVCYPVGVWEITFAKLLYAGVVGLAVSAPVALLPSLSIGLPAGDVLGVFAAAFFLSMITLAAGALTSHTLRLVLKRELFSPGTLAFLFVIISFVFTRIAGWLAGFVGLMANWSEESTASLVGLTQGCALLSPYHFGGAMLDAALGGPAFPPVPVLALPVVLLVLGYWSAKRLYPDIFEKE